MSKKNFFTQDGVKIPTWRVVQFLLSVRGFIHNGVRKQAAIVSSMAHLYNASPRTARGIWENRFQWLKVR